MDRSDYVCGPAPKKDNQYEMLHEAYAKVQQWFDEGRTVYALRCNNLNCCHLYFSPVETSPCPCHAWACTGSVERMTQREDFFLITQKQIDDEKKEAMLKKVAAYRRKYHQKDPSSPLQGDPAPGVGSIHNLDIDELESLEILEESFLEWESGVKTALQSLVGDIEIDGSGDWLQELKDSFSDVEGFLEQEGLGATYEPDSRGVVHYSDRPFVKSERQVWGPDPDARLLITVYWDSSDPSYHVVRSPYVEEHAWCSPCCPNQAHLEEEGNILCYCLPYRFLSSIEGCTDLEDLKDPEVPGLNPEA